MTKELNDTNSYGIDCIPTTIIKKCIVQIAKPLSAIINCSFNSGYFPDQLKIAKICPILKNGDGNIITNYRPISVLPSFSKVFEKIVHNRLSSYLKSNEILKHNQFGFRQNHSTYMAIQDMYNRISESIDNHNCCIGIFLDLAKAFDTVNHKILLKNLGHYGIRGLALQWFVDYLSNRKQYVCYNDASSSLKDITCGVPQGSILGPLLFIIYMNDIMHCSSLLHFILFADDTNLFYSCKSLSDLITITNHELIKVSQWFRANKLSLNVKKQILFYLVIEVN